MRRAEFLPAVAVGLAAFVAYVLTLYPSVPGGDSGELIGAIATGGVIHPPGYPLYALLGKLFLLLPLGSAAWRINLLSAVCDAAAAGLLTYAIARWTRSVWAGVAAGGLFAFSPGIWQYAICAEVFALNNLLVALLILLTILYSETGAPRFAFLGALVFGLGMSNHHTVIFTALPLAGWVLWRGRKELFRLRALATLIALFLAGLLPYAALPWWAGHHAPISWGNTDTWDGFWTHVLRREYGTFQLSPGAAGHQTQVGETLSAWSRFLLRDFGWWWLALAAWGLFEWAREGWEKRSRLHLVLLVPPLLSLAVLSELGNLELSKPLFQEILARFWQQPEIYACMACGFAVVAVERAVARPLIGPLAAVMIVGIQLGLHSAALNHRTSTLVRSYGSEILRTAPPNALLLTKGDLITSTIRYLQHLEGERSDVRLIDQELLAYDWYRAQITRQYPDLPLPPGKNFLNRELLDTYFGRQPIMVCGGLRGMEPSSSEAYELWPYGLCDSVHPRGAPPPIDRWVVVSEGALPRIDFGHESRPPGSWEEVVWGDYWEVRQTRAVQLLGYAGADPERRQYIVLAAKILDDIQRERPDTPPHVLKNLAIAYGRIGLDTSEQRARAADAWRSYLRAAPDDPQLPAIEAEIERLSGTVPNRPSAGN